jgi:hypothetical protein
MSFLKKLFGGGAGSSGPAEPAGKEDYKGFVILAEPYKAEGQFQVAGRITKTIDGVEKAHTFVRADRFASLEDATSIALMKGRQMIDQMGDGVFR